MATVNFAVRLVDWFFPDFEFGWLAKEMDESLPLEMDFRACPLAAVALAAADVDGLLFASSGVEAMNAARTIHDFADMRHTSLYVPEVKWVEKRILVMECESRGVRLLSVSRNR